MRGLLLGSLMWMVTSVLLAQPATDLFLLEVDGLQNAAKLLKVKNLTDRPGYDNQPSFAGNDTILYTSIRADGQADSYRFHLDSGQTERLTHTQESEYSPTLMADSEWFSVVRVEFDNTQRLWAFPLAGGAPKMLLTQTKPVGYHAWLTDHTLALFVLGEPHHLFWADTRADRSRRLLPSIGRGLSKHPNADAITFIDKRNPERWTVSRVATTGGEPQAIVPTLPGAEDFAWTAGGTLLMARASTLYRFQPGRDQDWQILFKLADQGIDNITRVAVSPNQTKLVVVSSR